MILLLGFQYVDACVCVYLFASNWYSTDFLLVKQQMAHLIQRILLSKCYMYSQHMHINIRFVGYKGTIFRCCCCRQCVCLLSEFNLQVKQFACCHSSLFGDPIRFIFFRLLYYVYAVMKCNQYFGARFYYVSLISTHKYLFFSFTYPIFFF